MWKKLDGVARFSWGVLAYNLLVIAWGAYVRASGSGAGCGSHWPTCDGEVIPRDWQVAKVIEYTHRLTSGLALISVVALCIWTFRARTKGHLARWGAAASVFFMLTEAAVGAGIVLFEYVADNKTMARALFMSVHLCNTFFLLAALVLCAYWHSGGGRPSLEVPKYKLVLLGMGCAALMMLGVSGAVTALGDTLFPAGSLAEGMAQDLSASSHLFIRLRVLHPLLAMAIGTYLVLCVGALGVLRMPGSPSTAGRMVVVLVFAQLSAGLLNVLLLAPIPMQLIHLLLSDLVWMAFILLGVTVLANRST